MNRSTCMWLCKESAEPRCSTWGLMWSSQECASTKLCPLRSRQTQRTLGKWKLVKVIWLTLAMYQLLKRCIAWACMKNDTYCGSRCLYHIWMGEFFQFALKKKKIRKPIQSRRVAKSLLWPSFCKIFVPTYFLQNPCSDLFFAKFLIRPNFCKIIVPT